MQDAPPASAMAPCGVTVFSPDLRLGNRNCQLDGFIITGGWGLLCIHDGVGLFSIPSGFVAQIGLRPISPLPQTDLAYTHGTWYSKRCEAV